MRFRATERGRCPQRVRQTMLPKVALSIFNSLERLLAITVPRKFSVCLLVLGLPSARNVAALATAFLSSLHFDSNNSPNFSGEAAPQGVEQFDNQDVMIGRYRSGRSGHRETRFRVMRSSFLGNIAPFPQFTGTLVDW
jgi:hypothetical protein